MSDVNDEPAQPQDNEHFLLRGVRTVDRLTEVFEKLVLAGGILGMATLMSLHVLGRALFNHGIPGTTEVVEMSIIVITFIGLSYAARHARHINMSAVYDQLRGRPRKILLIIISIGTAVLMFYFAWKSGEYAVSIYDRGRVSSTLRVPQWIVLSSAPVGFALAGIQYVLTTIRNLTSPSLYRSFTELEQYSDVADETASEES